MVALMVCQMVDAMADKTETPLVATMDTSSVGSMVLETAESMAESMEKRSAVYWADKTAARWAFRSVAPKVEQMVG